MKKWAARVQFEKDGVKKVFLDYFETPEEAYIAACKAAKELHGEFYNSGAL
jgi:hypothetical protein